ncbi:ly-6/neurotoxin-like protein 1 [Camelus ferus]|nr:ly-6/neurotoxin-like protein 1 [Camelus ferus]
MKTALLFLVALAVAAGPAQALRCHVCSSSSNCKKPQTCPASANFCRTMTNAMAPLLTLLLVALAGLPLAQALDCHVCAYNGENCFNPTRCPAMVTYCMTTRTYYTPTRMKVSKSCVTSCFETVYDGYSKHASTTACCQYDLCNGASLAAPMTLALALILLATFWGLL